MARNNQITRILRVLQILESHPEGLRAIEILKRLKDEGYDCVRETVYRDLAALQAAYIPLRNEGKADSATWKLDTHLKLNSFLTLSYPEILSLFTTRALMRNAQGSLVMEALKHLFQKIETGLGEKAVQALEEIALQVAVRPQAGWYQQIPQDTLDRIHHACAEGHMISFKYSSLNSQSSPDKERKVGPDGIYLANGGAYLIGREYPTQQRKTYALTRMTAVELMDDHYVSEEGFSMDQHFSASWGILSTGELKTVSLEIENPLASYVAERSWHSSQKIEKIGQGRVRLELSIQLNEEFVRWVLSLGSAARVVSPSELANLVQEECAKIQARYPKRAA